MATQLQDHINSITHLTLSDTIQAIAELTPHLTITVSATGVYLAQHPNYDGICNLNDLGKLYLECAERCISEHAPFETRLQHVSLEEIMQKLYIEGYEQFKEGYEQGTILPEKSTGGCGCCEGRPDAVILNNFHEGNALYFEEDEYRRIWGEQEECGSRACRNEEGGMDKWVMASREQVEEAMAREPVSGIVSHL